MYKPKYFYYETSEGKYCLKMQLVGYDSKQEKYKVSYTFTSPDKTVLFSGSDFYMPTHYEINSKAANNLLGFLTLRKGDTDKEYFDNYTDVQIAFSESFACEELQLYTD